MTDDRIAEHVADLERQLARYEGELHATLARLASLEATDEQRRVELEAARAGLASAEAHLEHARRSGQSQHQADQRRVKTLEARLADAEDARRTAERERSAVIAALGRGARRRLRTDAAS
jgi:chromosome segregation ATPase